MPESQALKIETNVAVPMRDGTILYADLYRPNGPEPYPVLLESAKYHIPTDLVVAQEALDGESSSRLDFLWLRPFGMHVVA